MNNLKDLTGQKFEKLTVIKRVENDKNNRVQYLCKLKDWALKLNMDYILLYNRIVIRKWSFEKAINTPIMTNRRKKSA